MHNNRKAFDRIKSQSSIKQKVVLGTIISVSCVGFVVWGYEFHQRVHQLKQVQTKYNDYISNCQVYLQNSTNAGTTSLAREELAKALPWLKNNSEDGFAFEYQAVKVNVEYLNTLPPHDLVPLSINSSTEKNSLVITQKYKARIDERQEPPDSKMFALRGFLLNLIICFGICVFRLRDIKEASSNDVQHLEAVFKD